MTTEESAKIAKVSWARLRQAVSAALVSCSKDDTRIALNSILFEFGPSKCRIIGTDGHRLTVIDVRNQEPCDEFSVLLSRQDALSWSKIEQPKDGFPYIATIALSADSKTVTFDAHKWSAKFKPETAAFPPYETIIVERRATPSFMDDEGQKDVGGIVGLQCAYLSDINAICDLVSDKSPNHGCRMQLGARVADPIRVDIEGLNMSAIHMLMPMRMNP